jgi:hypothetical protein
MTDGIAKPITYRRGALPRYAFLSDQSTLISRARLIARFPFRLHGHALILEYKGLLSLQLGTTSPTEVNILLSDRCSSKTQRTNLYSLLLGFIPTPNKISKSIRSCVTDRVVVSK